MKILKKILKTIGRIVKSLIKVIFVVGFICALIGITLSAIVMISTEKSTYSPEEFKKSEHIKENVDAIIVLGCGVWNNSPSPLLRDRLDTAIDLYFAGVSDKILMSGDHGHKNYNEVGVMRDYALKKGVPSEAIFMDHAGFSTYETMSRSSLIFGIENAVIVTQKYHLNRSIYNARAFGIKCVGVSATNSGYVLNPWYFPREIMAQAKDLCKCIYKPDPTFLGEKIDIHGNGEVTLDK